MKEKIIPIFLIIFFIAFSMWPTFYEWQHRDRIKPIRYFELVHNFPTDYNLYLSKIRQGKEGAWLAHEKYTAEPHEGSLSQILYVFIGRVSDWAHVQTPYVWFSYHIMRVFFAALLLIVIWKICQWAFPTFSWQIISFLLVVTASTWPKFEMVDGWPRFGGYMPWYTVIDSLQRTTFMPHVLFGQAMLAFILWVFFGGFIRRDPSASLGHSALSRVHPGNWIFLGFIGIILGIIFPPALVFVYAVLAILTGIQVIPFLKQNEVFKPSKAFRNWLKDELFGRVVFGLMTFPTGVYYALLFRDYPWKRLTEFDVLHPTKFSYTEYFLSLGATLPLGILSSLLLYITRKHPLSKKLLPFTYWIWAWLLLVFLFNFIPQQSPTRWSEMLPHLPLAMLTAFGALMLSSALGQVVKKLPIIIILFGLGTMISSALWQRDFVDHKLRADIPLVPHGAEVMYPLKDLAEAMVWLQVNTPRSAVVFSGEATGNMIPVYAGNTAFVGHANTVDAETKVVVVANFYGRKRPVNEFVDYFKKYNIQYVIYGPEEAELAYGAFDFGKFYPFLQEVYKNSMVTVYKVNL